MDRVLLYEPGGFLAALRSRAVQVVMAEAKEAMPELMRSTLVAARARDMNAMLTLAILAVYVDSTFEFEESVPVKVAGEPRADGAVPVDMTLEDFAQTVEGRRCLQRVLRRYWRGKRKRTVGDLGRPPRIKDGERPKAHVRTRSGAFFESSKVETDPEIRLRKAKKFRQMAGGLKKAHDGLLRKAAEEERGAGVEPGAQPVLDAPGAGETGLEGVGASGEGRRLHRELGS